MRTLLVLAALAVPMTASADNDHARAVAGTWSVLYKEVTTNCQDTGMVLTTGKVEIAKRKGNAITVDIERMPVMTGSAAKGGRVKATSKIGRTSIQGLDGRFSLAGSVTGTDNTDEVLSGVLVAEYYLSNKAFCTQSWNVTGHRVAADAAKPQPKPQAEDDSLDALGSAMEPSWQALFAPLP
jgi:hypothetical protein